MFDWDGTVTEHDTLGLVVEWFGDATTYRRNRQLVGRSLTHDQAALVERDRPLAVSSGFHELIEPFLAREGVKVELLANRVHARPEGWRISFRDRARCTVCGEAMQAFVAAAGRRRRRGRRSLGPLRRPHSDACLRHRRAREVAARAGRRI